MLSNNPQANASAEILPVVEMMISLHVAAEAGCEHNLDGYLKRACSPARTTHPTGSPNQEGEDGVTAIGEPDKQRSSLVGTSLSQEEFLLLHCFSDDAAMAAAIDAHRELYR